MEEPGIRCARCGNAFQDDEPVFSYAGTVKVTVAITNAVVEYDLCAICLGNTLNEMTGKCPSKEGTT
jgi:hypothetical protein